MVSLAKLYTKCIDEELQYKGKNEYLLKIKNTGKIDPKKHLQNTIEDTAS